MLASLIVGAILAIAHYLSELVHIRHKSRIISLAAGVSISYILLFLFPEFPSMELFLSTLIGFSIVHVIHNHVQKHRSSTFRKEMMNVHASAFFFYYVVIGITIVNIERFGIISLVLFSIPVALHTVASSTSLFEIHRDLKKNKSLAMLLASSTLLGIIIASMISFPEIIYQALLGISIGSLLYIVIRDNIPKKGGSGFFAAGVVFYMIVFALLQAL